MGDGDERLSMERLTDYALELLDQAEVSGDESHFGPVLHWAHILSHEQAADGTWPAMADARTGAAVGTARTRRPAALLERLANKLGSVEFDETVARARGRIP
jgi:hypothetical protein